MEWPSPWTFVGEEDGLFGALNDAEWFEGRRWVATSLGLFRSGRDDQGRMRFQSLPWAPDEVWDLQRVGDDLLVGERKSIQVIHADQATRLIDSNGVFELIPSAFVPGRVLALESTSILELDHAATWRAGTRHDLGEVTISTLVELAADRWLIGNWRGYPQLVTRSVDATGPHIAIRPLGRESGLGDVADAGSSVWQIGGKTYATLGDDLYEWRDERFIAQPGHPLVALAGQRLNEIEFRGGPGHQYAFTSRDVWVEQGGQWQPLRIESRRVLGVSELSLADDGRLTVVAWGGLLTYDPRLANAGDTAFHLRMHRALLTDAAYVPFVQTGNLVFLSGHIAKKDGKPWVGQLGKNIDTAQGKAAARAIAIDLLGTLHAAVGDLNKVKRIVKVMSLVNSTGDFTEQHLVTNGCSELLGEVFGATVGAHARSAFGVAQIPMGACVEIELIAEI